MKVQRAQLPNQVTWLVLDDDYAPVLPILSYLRFLHDLDRSPNTIRATAHRLKLFWEYLRDEHLCWEEIDVAQLAAFIRLPAEAGRGGGLDCSPPSETHQCNHRFNGCRAVYGLYSYHMRLGTIPELPLYTLAVPHRGRYKPFLHGIAKSKPEATRVVSVKPESRLPKTLNREQVQRLLDACRNDREIT